MKLPKTILLFLALLLLSSCGRNSRLSEQLDHISSVGDRDPELAIQMLDSLNSSVRSASKKIQARYDLLDVKCAVRSRESAPAWKAVPCVVVRVQHSCLMNNWCFFL